MLPNMCHFLEFDIQEYFMQALANLFCRYIYKIRYTALYNVNMTKVMTHNEYEEFKTREAAFNEALKESNKWVVRAKPIQQKQISQMLKGSQPILTPSEQ